MYSTGRRCTDSGSPSEKMKSVWSENTLPTQINLALRAARNKLRGRSCCPQSTTHRRRGAVRGNLVFWCSAFVCRRRNGFAFTHQSENTPLKLPCGREPTSGCGRPCQHACAMRCASCARAGLAARPMPMDRRREWPWW